MTRGRPRITRAVGERRTCAISTLLTEAVRGCDAVIHLAAEADVNEVLADPVDAERRNAGGTLHLLEAARRAEVRRVIYASTIWAYSDTPGRGV